MAYLEQDLQVEQERKLATFMDLATFDEIERYFYDDQHGVNYFKAVHEKKKWFTQIPVQLTHVNPLPTFGRPFSVRISRSGDYLLHTWLRVEIPAVSLLPGNEHKQLRWTRNLAHALIKECSFTANDVVVARFDNYNLDFWSAFMTPEEKVSGYAKMIGNVPELINGATTLPSYVLNLPLQFFWSRDVTRALPTAVLPFVDLRINFALRDWNELLIIDDLSEGLKGSPSSVPVVGRDISAPPSLGSVQFWANYAIVSGDERKNMACKARTTIIECAESAIGLASIRSTTSKSMIEQPVDFTLATRCLFFGIRNKTHPNQWSNYSTASPVPCKGATQFTPRGASDPIDHASLVYGYGTVRLDQDAQYLSCIAPWYHAERIPEGIGYHMYSYALSLNDVNPNGSTNFNRIADPKLRWSESDSLRTSTQDVDYPQTYESVLTSIGYKYIKYSAGYIKLEIE
jgi:hypothetical protein